MTRRAASRKRQAESSEEEETAEEHAEWLRNWDGTSEYDCGHRLSWTGGMGWTACAHAYDRDLWALRRGGSSGTDFLALSFDGDGLCRECKRRRELGLLPEGYRRVCARCAFDRLLAGEGKDLS